MGGTCRRSSGAGRDGTGKAGALFTGERLMASVFHEQLKSDNYV